MALTTKQKKFADEYMANGGNAYQAAKKAGYAEETALDAHKWVKTKNPKKPDKKYKPEVAEYIAAHSSEFETHNSKIATAEELQEFTSSVIRGEVKEFIVTATGEVVKVPANIRDRLKGVDMLAKMKGMYNEKLELNVKPIVLMGYDDVED